MRSQAPEVHVTSFASWHSVDTYWPYLRNCRRQLSWHADSGQLHVTIEPGSGRRFEVACDVAFLLRNTVCVAGPCFRPGRAAFNANGPGFRPDPQVLLLTTGCVHIRTFFCLYTRSAAINNSVKTRFVLTTSCVNLSIPFDLHTASRFAIDRPVWLITASDHIWLNWRRLQQPRTACIPVVNHALVPNSPKCLTYYHIEPHRILLLLLLLLSLNEVIMNHVRVWWELLCSSGCVKTIAAYWWSSNQCSQ